MKTKKNIRITNPSKMNTNIQTTIKSAKKKKKKKLKQPVINIWTQQEAKNWFFYKQHKKMICDSLLICFFNNK